MKKKGGARQGAGLTGSLPLQQNRAVYNYDLFRFDVQHPELPSELHFLLWWIGHYNVATVNNCDCSSICRIP